MVINIQKNIYAISLGQIQSNTNNYYNSPHKHIQCYRAANVWTLHGLAAVSVALLWGQEVD